MRSFLRAAASVALLSTVLLIPSTPALAAASSATRLQANPGFESGLTSWTADSSAATATTTAHSGSGALRIADSSTTAGVSVRGSALAVVPGERITAGIWVKQAVAGAGGFLYLEFRRADGSRTTPVLSEAAASSTSWQQLTVTGDVPDDAVTVNVLAYSSVAGSGTTYWDDATVSALPAPLRKVPNAGFEEQRDTSYPTQWATDKTGVGLVRGAAAFEGDTAVRITDGSTTDAVSVLSRAVPVGVGETITASAWANPLSGAGATLYLEFRDADGDRLSATTAAPGSAGSGWQRVGVTATAPASATTVTVRLYSLLGSVGTTTWDDVRLRSGADVSYAPALGAGRMVLFAGDQRVESYTGVTHKVFAGTKANTTGIVLGKGSAAYTANPRCSCTVLPGGTGEPKWKLWFSGSPQNGLSAGYATSEDGLTFQHVALVTGAPALGGVVANPAWTSGSAVPHYFGLSRRTTSGNEYYWVRSTDGIAWTEVPGSTPLAGFDVANVTWDPVTKLFVAQIKRHLSIPLGPRTTWVSTSTDFVRWSTPRPSFATDRLDDELITGAGKHGQTPWSEVYGMPAIRYGDQYLGTPWIFDITYSPNRDDGDNGPDKGRGHLELATSQDLVNWSRPSRGDLVTPGAAGSWDYGFQLGGTTLTTVTNAAGQQETRFYYGSFAGEHSCSAANVTAGDCDHGAGNSNVGMVSWPADRFASFHGAGTVTTRPLTPAGSNLTVNFAPGAGGDNLKVEVLDVDGTVLTGYGAADVTPITTDARAPGAQVTWGANTTLPSGPIRLRFTQTGGDLFAFTVD
ncbi:carbohydrate binding domain-containing protein [Actinoplanes cyaneus]|uniref:carbohydrate binding domain-containing protein n=1 Tax=Actinoplanes cyaneus TaxID=52696 RepID=UPI001EF1FDF7|nr:carbohydrate binding domain-containing protein [Actinoplanes cyaneus]